MASGVPRQTLGRNYPTATRISRSLTCDVCCYRLDEQDFIATARVRQYNHSLQIFGLPRKSHAAIKVSAATITRYTSCTEYARGHSVKASMPSILHLFFFFLPHSSVVPSCRSDRYRHLASRYTCENTVFCRCDPPPPFPNTCSVHEKYLRKNNFNTNTSLKYSTKKYRSPCTQHSRYVCLTETHTGPLGTDQQYATSPQSYRPRCCTPWVLFLYFFDGATTNPR